MLHGAPGLFALVAQLGGVGADSGQADNLARGVGDCPAAPLEPGV